MFEWAAWVGNFLVGGAAVAAIAALWKISGTLARIETDLRNVGAVVRDHEDRLRQWGV